MGMYDELKVVHTTKPEFCLRHSNAVFQTKGLECELNNYVVFNDVLYLSSTLSGERGSAEVVDHTGSISIYTDITEGDILKWIEYELFFKKGILADVVAREPRIKKDLRDLSQSRPPAYSNKPHITISVANCDQAMQDDMIELLTDQKIDEVRELLQAPTATVSFPTKKDDDYYGTHTGTRMITSVVQALSDLEYSDDSVNTTAPNGDKFKIILDEFWQLPQGK